MSAAQRRSAGPLPRLAPLGLLGLIACASTAPPAGPGADGGATGAATLRGEAWADNWFAAYIEDRLVGQDSVPITTERSFNAETFTFSATPPFTLSLVLKDYRENDTGLEYIGRANQQMGDGGFILQLTDLATSRVILGTSAAARCALAARSPSRDAASLPWARNFTPNTLSVPSASSSSTKEPSKNRTTSPTVRTAFSNSSVKGIIDGS